MNAIEVHGLSKEYRLGGPSGNRYSTLRDAISGFGRNLFSGRRRVSDSHVDDSFWALKDVSFELPEGEALGVIGRNGAGKSTLLKILSRIVEPSAGHARLRGRVASLLEVGTGFHPELTGRENIFLNGTILGMTRAEIAMHFDEIVAFAEVERFLDTPVKHYSSGMYVRLAFAVAAHLTSEILIVDEVLAVGDYEFQRRCLGRMNSVAHSGRTVLFVSHNMAAIEELCSRTLLLDHGAIECFDTTPKVVAHYLSSGNTKALGDLENHKYREGNGRARITRIELFSEDGQTSIERLIFEESFRVRLHYDAAERIPNPWIGLAMLTPRDERIFLTDTSESDCEIPFIEGANFLDCVVRSPNLLPGMYSFEAWIIDIPNVSFTDHLRMVGNVEIVVGSSRSGNLVHLLHPDRGRIFLRCDWRLGNVQTPSKYPPLNFVRDSREPI